MTTHHDDPIRQSHRLVDVVRDEDQSEAGLLPQGAEMVLQLERVKLSSALKGSSSTSTSGLLASARAMATR